MNLVQRSETGKRVSCRDVEIGKTFMAAKIAHPPSKRSYNLRSNGGDEDSRKRLRSLTDVPGPTKTSEKHVPMVGQRKEGSTWQKPPSSSGSSSSTPSAQNEMKQNRPQTTVDRYGSLNFDSEESEESEDDMLTVEELKKTEGWALLVNKVHTKFGRKSDDHKSTG